MQGLMNTSGTGFGSNVTVSQMPGMDHPSSQRCPPNLLPAPCSRFPNPGWTLGCLKPEDLKLLPENMTFLLESVWKEPCGKQKHLEAKQNVDFWYFYGDIKFVPGSSKFLWRAFLRCNLLSLEKNSQILGLEKEFWFHQAHKFCPVRVGGNLGGSR